LSNVARDRDYGRSALAAKLSNNQLGRIDPAAFVVVVRENAEPTLGFLLLVSLR